MLELVILLFCSAGEVAVKSIVRPDEATSANLLVNPGFERIAEGKPPGWLPYEEGFEVDGEVSRSGGASIRCEGSKAGAYQAIALNQDRPRPLLISGWSKAEGVDGSPDNNYSLYVDIIYADGTPLWGQTARFNTGTHDWEYRERIIMPEKPIKELRFYALFRGHSGRVWFDDLRLVEIRPKGEAIWFDGSIVQVEGISPRLSVRNFEIAADDKLRLVLNEDGWVVGALWGEDELPLRPSPLIYLRDFNANSDLIAPGGRLAREGDLYRFVGGTPSLGLKVELRIIPKGTHLRIDGEVRSLKEKDRAITLYISLPIGERGWLWWDYARRSTVISKAELMNAKYCGAGATGHISIYPMGCVQDEGHAVCIGIPMDRPRLYRIGYNGWSRELFIAFDFGLAPEPIRYPFSADFSAVIYGCDPEWGFRSALKRYYEIFPQFFIKRVEKEGIWMPFTDISTVEGYEDFGFAFHEGTNNLKFDDQIGVYSFRYTEPMTYWQRMPRDVPRTYEGAVRYLERNFYSDDKRVRDISRATKLCGIYDKDGRYVLRIRKAPWCDGCVFTLNPSPEIPEDEFCYVNKGHLNYTPQMADRLYSGKDGQLDGEYLDSLEGWGTDKNFRREHFRYVRIPLTFDPETGRPIILQIFSTYEFARYVSEDIHRRGKLMMANAVPWRFGFLGHLLDVMGTETNWMPDGRFRPESDEIMIYRRAICYQKPYLLLMNTFFDQFTPDKVEIYMKRCLFYGIFPSMFSHNAADDPYWRNPRWYNRDRHLFKKYIPLIKLIASAGWEPITGARSSNPAVYLERFGDLNSDKFYLTALNPTEEGQESEIVLPVEVKEVRELIRGEGVELIEPKKVEVEIGPGDVALLELRR